MAFIVKSGTTDYHVSDSIQVEGKVHILVLRLNDFTFSKYSLLSSGPSKASEYWKSLARSVVVGVVSTVAMT